MSTEVISIGRINLDVIMRVRQLPTSQQHLTCEEGYVSPGGSAANFAAQSAKLGVKTGLVACIGNDRHGQIMLEHLTKSGVDTQQVLVLDRQSTGIFTCIHDSTGGSMVIVEPGANRYLERQLIDECVIAANSIVHVAGAFPRLAQTVAEIASMNGMIFSFDPGRAASSIDLKPIVRHTDLLFLNENELRQYFGLQVNETELKKLAKAFPGILIIKMASRGAAATDGFEYVVSKAFDVPVVDTIGAGDAFAAGFVTTWFRCECLECALNVANAVAALKITQHGAQVGQPTLNDLERFLLKQGVSIHESTQALKRMFPRASKKAK